MRPYLSFLPISFISGLLHHEVVFEQMVVLYDDELTDNGVLLLTVKVLRVDGVLMRSRGTHMYCAFENSTKPIILQESCWR
ncbi:hypothetical protein HHK36_002663 [Tetracentron sinense]|uniref:Uncharacterized protein n=1 Tax=Tetracentron sinense TaxID=13715 RepID=A0A834ZMV8_TETSI|nr:hypothetical protein HHK36_002663 [Tetracentron sinense]